MNVEIISIGTELLLGNIANTNTVFLSQKLAESGIDVYYTSVVGDNITRLNESLKRALLRSDVVITTGGLGPTVDDITTQTISKLISKRLVLNTRILKDLENYFRMRGMKVLTSSVRQAYIPEGVRHIRNKVGIAPGLIVRYKGKIIVCLPGPPRELQPMFEEKVIPYLQKRNPKRKWILRSQTIKLTGIPESVVNKSIKRILNLRPPTTVGIYCKLGEVDLRIVTKARDEKTAAASIMKVKKKIRERLKDFIFGYGNSTLEGIVGRRLDGLKKTIAIAESCTGGLLASRITDVAGSSRYFAMGIVAYSNAAKENILGVSSQTIEKYGAVSPDCALEMAQRIRLLAGSDIGVGMTGIAGPTGGTIMKPVGLVYISVVFDSRRLIREFRFKGSREEIKFQASQAALDLLRKTIR
ncbi:MAG: competence/damage-inducible protein A [Candidatus Omnitrophota bacterium]